jgi:hypothetical protein
MAADILVRVLYCGSNKAGKLASQATTRDLLIASDCAKLYGVTVNWLSINLGELTSSSTAEW